MILVIAEQRDGVLHRASWEPILAAQQTGQPVQVAVAGVSLASVAGELAAAEVEAVLTIEHPALESYTPDGFVAVFADVVTATQPDLVFLPHTYQTREFAPKLAVRLGRSLITDCIAVKQRDNRLAFVRPMFQGKFVADVAPTGPAPHFASFQIGAFRPDGVSAVGIEPPRRNWALKFDKPPFEGFPVVCGMTFCYGGLKTTTTCQVTHTMDRPIPGLYAVGEMLGGLWHWNYPSGGGMMAGAVFGRIAGTHAAVEALG